MSHGNQRGDLVLPGVLVVVLILGVVRLVLGAFDGWWVGADAQALRWALHGDDFAVLVATDVERSGAWPSTLLGTYLAAALADDPWTGIRTVTLAAAGTVVGGAAALARGGALGRVLAAIASLLPVAAVLGDQGSLGLGAQLACWVFAAAAARHAFRRRDALFGLAAGVLLLVGWTFGVPMVDPAALLLAQVLVGVVVGEACGVGWSRGGPWRAAAGLGAVVVVVLGLGRGLERDVGGQDELRGQVEALAALAELAGSERVTLEERDDELWLVALYGVRTEAREPGEPRSVVFDGVAGVYPDGERWRELVRSNALGSVRSRGVGGEELDAEAGRRGVRGSVDASTQDWLLEVEPGRYVVGRHRSAKDPGPLHLADSCGRELSLPALEPGELARLEPLELDPTCAPLVLSGVTPARAAAGGVVLALLPEVHPSLDGAAQPMLRP